MFGHSYQFFGAASFAVVAFTTGCDDSSLKNEILENQHEKIRLQQQVELLTYRLEQTSESSHADLAQIQELSVKLAKQLNYLKIQRDLNENAQKTLNSQITEAQQKSISSRQQAACGSKMDRIVIRDGKTYQQVNVTNINDAGVSIRHQDGAATLRFSDLTPEQQSFFGLDEHRSQAAENRELQSSIAYEAWVGSQTQSQLGHNGSLAKATFQEQIQADLQTPAQKTVTSTQTSLLSAPPKTFGNGNIYRYRTSRPKYRNYFFYQPDSRYYVYPPCPYRKPTILKTANASIP